MEPIYLDQLNPQQREAVCCTETPSLVIAGAGSGKTRVLTTKIAFLMDAVGIQPQNIMALTFTNKAAMEMKQRIATMVGTQSAMRITMGTFHSIFARILRKEHQYIGYTADFTIYDSEDSKSLIKEILKSMQLDEKKQYKPSSVLSRISRAKNQLIVPEQYPASYVHADQACNMSAILQIYKEYQERLRKANAMDFDDLLLQTWLLFQDHPQVADDYQDFYHYILVDEYQDTNYAQHQIVLQLTKKRQRICVVGDDAQSIYSFRGAEISNILHFQEAYQGSRLFKLEQNYRSTQIIVDAANSLIKHNKNQIPKQIFSRNQQGVPIEVFYTYSDVDEASTIVRYLSNLQLREHMPFSDIAILYRTNPQSRSLEEELRRRGIPYRIYGGLSFYQRKEIKDAIAYLRLCVNPLDETALHRVINYPARGIGNTTIDRVWKAASDHKVSPWQIIEKAPEYSIPATAAKRLAEFASLIQGLRQEMAEGIDVYTLMLKILSMSGMQAEIFRGATTEDLTRQQNLQELTDSINTFVQERQEQGLPSEASDYLQEVSLLTDQDESKDKEDTERVTLMTVHASKGLEFKTVFVAGLEENLFPNQMDADDPKKLEEERRLFYVAMTRAGEHLILTCARSRMRYGHVEFSDPCRFLDEINPSYLHINGRRTGGRSQSSYTPPDRKGNNFAPRYTSPERFTTSQREVFTSGVTANRPAAGRSSSIRKLTPTSNFTSPFTSSHSLSPQGEDNKTSAIKPGQKIIHERFGPGIVERIEGTGMDTRATVSFESAGKKQLLLRFARFKTV
ncbi:MAG: ATP-dependent helicase [Bacteroidaceae bacterium]